MGAFTEFFNNVINAKYDFGYIYTAITNLLSDIPSDSNIMAWWGAMWDFISYFAALIPFVILILCALIAVFGNKIFSVLRFTAFFISGFVLGLYWLSPLILPIIPTLPTWVIGVVGGVVAGVLSKLLYILLYAIVSGYSVYIVFCGGIILPLTGNYVVALIAAVAAIVLAFVLKQHIEMAGTAMLGGFGMATVIRYWYDFTTWDVFVGREWLGMLLLTVIFAIVGYLIQYNTRERY